MATIDSVQKVLATSPMPLAASTIAELTGSDQARVQTALVELASRHQVRRVNHRWATAYSGQLTLPTMAHLRR